MIQHAALLPYDLRFFVKINLLFCIMDPLKRKSPQPGYICFDNNADLKRSNGKKPTDPGLKRSVGN